MKTDHIKFLVLDVDGTMTDGRINVMSDGTVFKQFSAKDGLGIKMLIKKGIDVGIISHSASSEAIYARAKVLGIKYAYAGFEEKNIILEQWIEEKEISYDEVAYIGDDLNDLPVMEKASISACPSDASDEVISYVDVVLKNVGGNGCVREFIDNHIGITYLGFQ